MRSHHAPTKYLLGRFTHKDRTVRNGRSIWVYEKGRRARVSSDLSSECAQNGYFAGGTKGEQEQEIEKRFNLEYEVPFNDLLPSLDSGILTFDNYEIRQICSLYIAHLFRRSVALREGASLLISNMVGNYRVIANDPKLMLLYAAKASAMTGKAVPVKVIHDALVSSLDFYSSDEGKKALFVNDIDRGTRKLASELIGLNWSILRPATVRQFAISDTPVVSMSRNWFGDVQFGVGIWQPNSEWFLPISAGKVIRVSGSRLSYSIANDILVDQLNYAQIATMTRRLYGREYSSWTDDMVQVYGGHRKYHVDVFQTKSRTSSEEDVDDILGGLGLL